MLWEVSCGGRGETNVVLETPIVQLLALLLGLPVLEVVLGTTASRSYQTPCSACIVNLRNNKNDKTIWERYSQFGIGVHSDQAAS